MVKQKTMFVCQECGYESPAYLGKCPECGNWNSLKEFKIKSSEFRIYSKDQTPVKAKTIAEVSSSEKERVLTGFLEMDSVFGGGIVKGSVTLLAGDPGIGKSTLLLQVAMTVARGPVLYVSAEESEEQVKLRFERLSKNSKTNTLRLLSARDTDAVCEVIAQENPTLVIVDSIQTMESEAAGGLSGSISQIRYGANQFVRTAKTLGIPVILVGHVTKEGMVAGPMLLSHMVDTVLFLEGEKTTGVRILRSLKNRFGPVDEVGIFTMAESGMEEITNPSSLFIDSDHKNVPGTVLTATISGSRAFLLEIQSLCVFSKLPMPRRVAIGIDPKRLELLLAVLQKHANLPVATMDVFVNVAGGLKITDPAVDLSICLSILSSIKNIAMAKTVAISEVGLLGELRSVSFLEKRIKEAKKLGFSKIVSNKTHTYLLDVIKSLDQKEAMTSFRVNKPGAERE